MELPKLKAEEYWEWRVTLADLEIAKLKYSNNVLLVKNLEKDVEALNLKMQLFKSTQLKNSVTNVEESKIEYERFKGVLESRLGLSLNSKLIDDITFEVKDLPTENKETTQGGV